MNGVLSDIVHPDEACRLTDKTGWEVNSRPVLLFFDVLSPSEDYCTNTCKED